MESPGGERSLPSSPMAVASAVLAVDRLVELDGIPALNGGDAREARCGVARQPVGANPVDIVGDADAARYMPRWKSCSRTPATTPS